MLTRKALNRVFFVTALLMAVGMMVSCDDGDDETHETHIVALAKVKGYNEFDAMVTTVTHEQRRLVGFKLGDEVTVEVGGKILDMPFFDGYYVRTGEFLMIDYPSNDNIIVTRNNLGVPDDMKGLEGCPLRISLKTRGKYLDVQQILGMEYTNNREDYSSDEVFANAREVRTTGLASGRLFRSASPFNNKANRAPYASAFCEKHGVKTVLNLADTEEEIHSYDLPPYSQKLLDEGGVILCPLKSNPGCEEFSQPLIAVLKKFSHMEAPYLVHCVEGKDRTGYVCALLEGLCGASYDEIAADYLVTYDNYYGVTPQNAPKACSLLLSLRLNECLEYYAGVKEEDLKDVDYKKAISDFLLTHGMTEDELQALVKALTE